MPSRRRLSTTGAVLLALGAIVLVASGAQAQSYEVTITNLTPGQILSPPIVFTHGPRYELFQAREPAIPELAAVAEDADAGGLLALLVTTNDAFISATTRVGILGTTTYAPAWDAGSEANTQDCDHIPGPPCGNMFVRVTDGAEGFIHIHNGIQDRDDPMSDLMAKYQDWRNPVAKISVRRR